MSGGVFMIDLTGMISVPFLKKSVFTGSHKGMNFLVKKVSDDDGDKIRAIAWPGPFNFEVTADEKKVSHDVPFGQDGILEAVKWLNEHYDAEFNKKK
jgi:hypothetical protein